MKSMLTLLSIVVAGSCSLSTAWAKGEAEEVGSTSDPLRVAPQPQRAPAPAAAGNRCKPGYVWREARKGDVVCVPPATRDAVAAQNRSTQRLWTRGAYGPHTCIDGYVWREAFDGDTTCVKPEDRSRARQDNAMAARRRVGG